MNLPFTPDEFIAVFAAHNRAIWPLQMVAFGLGLMPRYALMRFGIHTDEELMIARSGWRVLRLGVTGVNEPRCRQPR